MRAIRREDLENIIYYQTPKWLFDLLLEGKITAGAFSTYILMYDRTRLSSKNNWIDDNGEVYIKYSYEEMAKDLKVKSNTQVQRNLKKLKELNLIDSKRNFNNSNTYYLNIYSLTQNVSNSLTQNVSNSLTQFVETNKNNFSKNNFSKKHVTCNGESEKQKIEDPKKEVTLNPKGYPQKDKWENFLNENLVGIDYTPGIETAIKKLEVNMSEKQIKESLSFTYENGKATGRTLGEIATIIERGNALRSKEKVEVKPKVEEKEEPKMNPKFDTREESEGLNTGSVVANCEVEKKELSPEEEERALQMKEAGERNFFREMKKKNIVMYWNSLRSTLSENRV
ncbi:MAG: replication initiator protein A [Cetobacterium sp.]